MRFRFGFLLLLFSIALFPVSVFGSTWAKTYGGSPSAYAYSSIQQTSDGGFIFAGRTGNGAGSYDIWVLKLNSSGNVTWQKTYGGPNWDDARSVQQTSDGGYIVGGSTSSYGAGGYDFWVLKLTSTGSVSWQKTYGGPNSEEARSIQQTSDGGYIVAGDTSSYGAGEEDYWVLKLNSTGNVTWQKTYGGPNNEDVRSIQQTSDGGYIVGGSTSSYGDGLLDIWLLKLNSSGNVTWQKTYGGSSKDGARSVQQTSDGGYIVGGSTGGFIFYDDFYLLKLNASGNIVWQKTYGGPNIEEAYSIQQTSDGGYIVAGQTTSYGAGSYDIWLLKLNSTGNVTWQKTYGGGGEDHAESIQQTSDGGYIVSAWTTSYGPFENWVLKIDANGNIPGCGLIQNTSANSFYSLNSSANTSVTAMNSGNIIMSQSPVTTNTSATVDEQCFYEEPSTTDLGYAPVSPCRVVDTRLAGGAMSPGTIRGYNVWGNVASQGGNPSGCPSPSGEPYGVHINVTAVPVSGSGNIVAYPFASSAPTASLVNYKTGAQNIANGGTIKTCYNCDKDINIKSNYGTTHVVIDVLGYYFDNPWH